MSLTKAEDCFERALAIARAQQAKSWELRTATSLARLWRAIRASRSRPTIFSPRSTTGSPRGFDTLDLKEAKALLDAQR
jgi:hypothetical protein